VRGFLPLYHLSPVVGIGRLLLLFLLAWVGFVPALLASVEEDFNAANRLYEQGRYAEAASAYQQLVAQDHVNATVWFNLGNARYQAGQLGRAIAAYTRAQRLAPRDGEILNNLRMARMKAGHKQDESLASLLGRVRPNTWAVATGLAVCLWFALRAVMELKPERRLALRNAGWGLGFAAVLLGTAAFVVAHDQLWTRRVIVNVPEAVIRRGPIADSQSKSTPPDGTELEVLDRKDEWLNVRAADGLEGWILERHVEPLGGLAE
jgi:tetratricopeptide (TPR) repeat protein